VKRFYGAVSVTAADDGWRVALDARELRSPARRTLSLPTAALAEAVAAEWDAQDAEIVPRSMPLMKLVSTAVDRIAPDPSPTVADIARYGETDLVCYRADRPRDLVLLQYEGWQPLLRWLEASHGIRLAVTEGVLPRAQDRGAIAALRTLAASRDPLHLAALHAATTASGSVVVGLALLAREIDAEAAWRVSRLDEIWQAEQWGEDVEAIARAEALRVELEASRRLVDLLDLSA